MFFLLLKQNIIRIKDSASVEIGSDHWAYIIIQYVSKSIYFYFSLNFTPQNIMQLHIWNRFLMYLQCIVRLFQMSFEGENTGYKVVRSIKYWSTLFFALRPKFARCTIFSWDSTWRAFSMVQKSSCWHKTLNCQIMSIDRYTLLCNIYIFVYIQRK